MEKYFLYRQGLINQYVKGDMTKAEYLERNLDAVLSLNIKPFQNIDSVDKGLFNYQYYNAMAKHTRLRQSGEDYEIRKEIQEQVDYYYQKKDKATLMVLKLMDFQNISAYFIHCRSKQLKGKLFEIIINRYEMILHSQSPVILNRLREERVFMEETRTSLIDGYINQKY